MRNLLICGTVGLVAMALGTAGAAADDLKAGDQAPPFELPGTDGQTHSLSDLSGRAVVLAWFPKAFTRG